MSSIKTTDSTLQRAPRSFPSKLSISIFWLKREGIAWMKEPAAVMLNMAYPLIMMLFLFIVGGNDIRQSEEFSTTAVALLGLIGVLMVGINLPANGINEIRGGDYYYFLRSLPAGAGTRLFAWGGAPLILAIASGAVALLVGSVTSAANYSAPEVILLFLLYFFFGACCTFIGTFFGFLLSKKAP